MYIENDLVVLQGTCYDMFPIFRLYGSLLYGPFSFVSFHNFANAGKIVKANCALCKLKGRTHTPIWIRLVLKSIPSTLSAVVIPVFERSLLYQV